MANHHERKLIESRADIVVLAHEVEFRYLKLCRDYVRIKQVQLAIPAGLQRSFIRWRELRVRHKCVSCGSGWLAAVASQILINVRTKMPYCAECGGTGDYRHREAELKALEDVARWTLTVKAELTGQDVPEWEGIPR